MRRTIWTNLPLRVKGLVVVAIPVAALLVSLLPVSLIQRHADEQRLAAAHIVEVRNQIKTVETQLLNAETGVRGYQLSNNEAFLDPYHASFDKLPGALAALERLVGDDPSQLARAQRVRFLTGQKLETLSALRANLGTPQQRAEMLERDNQFMNDLRVELSGMRSEEEKALEARVEELEDSQRAQGLAVVIAALLGLGGGLLAMMLFTTGVAHRVERLGESAAQLAEGQPLPSRPEGHDEVGRLADKLGEAAALLAVRERELLDAKDQAERANWAKSDFLSRTSHELRTPLAAITGFSQVLLNRGATPDQADLLERVLRAAEHVAALLEDVLDLARIEAGSLPIDLQPVDLRTVADEAIELVSNLAEQYDVAVAVELGGVEGAAARADRRRLRQVLINLLSNGIKYNSSGGTVVVLGEQIGDRVVVRVRDDGPGIPPNELERLFEPYDRLGAEASEVRGVGLGLTVTQSLVEIMHGKLSVESRPGHGSTFSVELAKVETSHARHLRSVDTAS